MIFGYLTPTEIASLRLLSSNIAAIGLKYIAITVTLTLQEDTFDRLLDIAHHPVVSKSVRNLRYEHGSFSNSRRTKWEHRIITPKLVAAQLEDTRSRFPGNNSSKRDLRAFHRERNARKAYYTYGKKRLDQAFSSYQKHCAEEDRARRSGFFLNKLISAVQHFPNLETICMLSGSCRRYNADIAKILKGAYYNQPTIDVHNVAVTRSVLAAVDQVIRDSQIMNGDLVINDQVKTGPGDGTSNRHCPEFTMPGRSQSVLRIKHLVLEDFDWRLLLEGDQVFSTMERSLSHLTKLEIHLLAGMHNESSKVDDHLCQFVKLAPDLEELSVSLDGDPWPLSSVGLRDIIGSFHWTSLKTAHFFEIVIHADNLQDFCLRHSSTLSNLRLGNIFMVGYVHLPGKSAWYPMFTKIREAQLDNACIFGHLITFTYRWDMHDRRDGRRESGTLIGRYLEGEGGRSSLEDFMRDERRRIPRQDRSSFNGTETEWSESSTSDSENSSSEDDA